MLALLAGVDRLAAQGSSVFHLIKAASGQWHQRQRFLHDDIRALRLRYRWQRNRQRHYQQLDARQRALLCESGLWSGCVFGQCPLAGHHHHARRDGAGAFATDQGVADAVRPICHRRRNGDRRCDYHRTNRCRRRHGFDFGPQKKLGLRL